MKRYLVSWHHDLEIGFFDGETPEAAILAAELNANHLCRDVTLGKDFFVVQPDHKRALEMGLKVGDSLLVAQESEEVLQLEIERLKQTNFAGTCLAYDGVRFGIEVIDGNFVVHEPPDYDDFATDQVEEVFLYKLGRINVFVTKNNCAKNMVDFSLAGTSIRNHLIPLMATQIPPLMATSNSPT